MHPMILLDLNQNIAAANPDKLSNLIEVARLVRDAKGSRLANQFLMDGVGLIVNSTLNESYHAQALDYHLGLVYAHLNQPELAVEHIARSTVLPGTGGNPIFSEHVAESLRLHADQSSAAARGIPSILIASMPRSGSVSLTQSIAASLGVAVMRVSVGAFPNYLLVPRWVDAFSPGGAVAHDHFSASPFNLRTLNEAGIREVFVLARDPRASAASSVQLEISHSRQSYPAEHVERRIVDLALSAFIPWLERWVEASRIGQPRVHWLKYKETTTDMAAAVRRVLQVYRSDHAAVEAILESRVQTVTGNFVQGNDEAWRSLVGPCAQRRLSAEMSAEAVKLLGIVA